MSDREQRAPIIFGLTGGIASGKSTVTGMLRELGACVIDADDLARQVVAPGSEGLEAVREAFGDAVIAPDGSLDRATLGARIFSDETARGRLGQITHPRIAALMMRDAAQAARDGHEWVVYDAALLVESGTYELFAALIVVAVDPETQLERLMARDGSTREQALARVRAQLPLQDKIAVADCVIDNAGTLAQTRAQVEALFGELQARAAAVKQDDDPHT